jgi:hypothetical protein
MSTTKTPRSTTDHVVMDMSKGDLLCTHCGDTHHIQLPVAIDMWVAQAKVFTKNHRSCKKTWVRPPDPVPDMSQDMAARIEWWKQHGKRGVSSNTMLEVITGHTCTSGAFGRSHPYDIWDFRRCYWLLRTVPELRDGFPQLAKQSATWARVVARWDDLLALLPDPEDAPLSDSARALVQAILNDDEYNKDQLRAL